MAGTSSNQAHVAPGAKFTVLFDYSAWGTGPYCPGCVTQYYIGISPNAVTGAASGAAVGCFLNTVFGGSLQTGSTSFDFTAPSTSGIYYIVIDGPTLDFVCHPALPSGTPQPAQYIGAISVY
jgi:hypothetical protein